MWLVMWLFAVEHLNALPPGLEKIFKTGGRIVDSIRYDDKLGDNVVFVVVEETKNGIGIYGHHYVYDERNVWTQIWKTQDGVFDCEVDMTARYLPKTLDAMDLDKDGTYETSFAYETACRGDVSPTSVKVLMHEGEKKFALRGSQDGTSTPDDAFKSAPPSFLAEAKKRFVAAVKASKAP